jgi:polar amino acid transport system ATP-binding protein
MEGSVIPQSGKTDTAPPAGLVKLERVNKSFGRLQVLRDITLEVQKGEVVCIIGPSGAGKSTLLRCVNHLEPIDSGAIYFDGRPAYQHVRNGKTIADPDSRIEEIRSQIGMVFQSFNLFPHLTAIGNIIEAPVHVRRVAPERAREEAIALLKKVGLIEKAERYPHELSGGQQQRVAIARALAMNPKLMLFDEATSALDPELVGEVLRVMRQLASEGMTMMVVTHEMDFAREAADRVVFMADAAILEEGPPQQMFSAPANARTRQFLQTILDRNGRTNEA